MAQEEQRLTEIRYRAALIPLDAIAITRLDDGMYIECNAAFLESPNQRHEVIGKTSQELAIWVDLGDREGSIKMLRQHASCRDLQTRFRKKNGELLWGLTWASLLNWAASLVSCPSRGIIPLPKWRRTRSGISPFMTH